MSESLKVNKTIKLFIGGEFPRTESGRSFPLYFYESKKLYANQCRASRKDLRNAVEVAQKAQNSWAAKTAYNRSQILYRMAEMAESKRSEFVEVLEATLGLKDKKAHKAVDRMINAFVYYAGFADKYQQVIGAVNHVAGPHHNFSTPEAVGVVGMIASEDFDLGELSSQIAAVICSGNTLVLLMEQKSSALLAPLSEVFATSDLPGGVINLLTGFVDELLPHFITHMEIQSLSFQRSDKKEIKKVQEESVENMKRIVLKSKEDLSLENILNHVEIKTVWHPVAF